MEIMERRRMEGQANEKTVIVFVINDAFFCIIVVQLSVWKAFCLPDFSSFLGEKIGKIRKCLVVRGFSSWKLDLEELFEENLMTMSPSFNGIENIVEFARFNTIGPHLVGFEERICSVFKHFSSFFRQGEHQYPFFSWH